MTRYRILVPTDFSDCAEHAAELAYAIAAGRDDAEIILLHVSPMPDFALLAVEPMYLPPQIWDRLWDHEYDKIQLQLDALEVHLRSIDDADVHITASCRRGNPVTEILAAAAERRPDVIAMGSHGAGALRYLFGGTASRVARDAHCPVLLVPQNALTRAPRRALVAVDYSRFSEPAVRLAADVVSLRGMITCLHVWQEPPLVPVDPFAEFAEVVERARGAAVDDMDAFVNAVDIGDRIVTKRVEVGSPAPTILECSRELGADLIVVGSHSRHGVERVIGTTADRVLRHAAAAVLLIPEGAVDAYDARLQVAQ